MEINIWITECYITNIIKVTSHIYRELIKYIQMQRFNKLCLIIIVLLIIIILLLIIIFFAEIQLSYKWRCCSRLELLYIYIFLISTARSNRIKNCNLARIIVSCWNCDLYTFYTHVSNIYNQEVVESYDNEIYIFTHNKKNCFFRYHLP